MNQELVDKIAKAVLYEGYILYPYRPSVKNRQRWTFGGLYPQSYNELNGGTDAWTMQTQCLMQGTPQSVLSIRVRFLQLTARTVGKFASPLALWKEDPEPQFQTVERLDIGAKQFECWQEAVERQIALDDLIVKDLIDGTVTRPFSFPAQRTLEPLTQSNGTIAGVLVRQQQSILGTIEVSAHIVVDGTFKLTVRIINRTRFDAAANADRDAALMHSLVSTHTILNVRDGQFVSMIDPPLPLQQIARECKNVGTWPVLVGDAGAIDAVLSSPIILYDYPQIAPESPGDLFDSTEIDEILTLRIMTLTDEEKRSAASIDPRAEALLARTESLAREQLMGLHGTFRGLRPGLPSDESAAMANWDPLQEKRELERVLSAGIELKPGDRVRLRPHRRADILDLALDGKAATIAAIEQDYENRIHVAVTVDDDPGKDIGEMGKIGHRFFFAVDEVELV